MEWTPSQKGAIAETAITAAAVELGIGVYTPVAEGGRYDMIFDLGSRLVRVQCKWAVHEGAVVSVRCQSNRRTASGFLARPYTSQEIDAIAAYCAELRQCYFLPISLVDGRRQVYLRLSPTKNNQARGVNFAVDYELGAIAQLGERPAGSREVVGSSPTSSTEKAAHNGRLFS
jgi:PD-(D/E)XK endonuclease